MMMSPAGPSARRRARRARALVRGLTLPEIIVVMTIIALLAAIVVPTVIGRIREGSAGSIGQTIDALRNGVLEYRADVRRYPTHLRYLSAAPGSATDICGQTVPASFLTAWKGPYVNRTIGTTGLKLDDVTVLDSIVRTPTTFTASTTGELSIRVQDVDSIIARRIKRDQDITTDFTTGTIRWTNVLNGIGILQLIIPVRGC
jgi:prepilin-type N-terminal cleavage/methylation domain-containing protein